MTEVVSHPPAHDDAHAAEGHHSHGGIGKYIAVFFALCVLTSMSFWTSPESNFPIAWPFQGNVAVTRIFMLGVSCTKATLVILFFMHVLWEANWKYVLTIPAAMMSLFLMLMLVPDVGMRYRHASQERKLHASQLATPRQPAAPAPAPPAAAESPDTE